MALPIAPTPVLSGQDAKRFLEEVAKHVNQPAKLSPPPDFKKIKQIKLKNWGKKQNPGR